MELRKKLCIAVGVLVLVMELGSCNFVFKVQHKFAGKEKKLAHFKSHDTRRHSRMLASLDLPLGGDSRVDSVGFCSYPSLSRTCALHFSTNVSLFVGFLLQFILHQNQAWVATKGISCSSRYRKWYTMGQLLSMPKMSHQNWLGCNNASSSDSFSWWIFV